MSVICILHLAQDFPTTSQVSTEVSPMVFAARKNGSMTNTGSDSASGHSHLTSAGPPCSTPPSTWHGRRSYRGPSSLSSSGSSFVRICTRLLSQFSCARLYPAVPGSSRAQSLHAGDVEPAVVQTEEALVAPPASIAPPLLVSACCQAPTTQAASPMRGRLSPTSPPREAAPPHAAASRSTPRAPNEPSVSM